LLASRKDVATSLQKAVNIVSASQHGSMSAVALDVCHGSLAHRGWHACSTLCLIHSYGKVYITPHCIKYLASH